MGVIVLLNIIRNYYYSIKLTYITIYTYNIYIIYIAMVYIAMVRTC